MAAHVRCLCKKTINSGEKKKKFKVRQGNHIFEDESRGTCYFQELHDSHVPNCHKACSVWWHAIYAPIRSHETLADNKSVERRELGSGYSGTIAALLRTAM